MDFFTSPSTSKLFELLFPSINISLLSVYNAATPQVNFSGMDDMCIPRHCGTVADWILTIMYIISKLVQACDLFHVATLWIPSPYILWPVPDRYIKCFQ